MPIPNDATYLRDRFSDIDAAFETLPEGDRRDWQKRRAGFARAADAAHVPGAPLVAGETEHEATYGDVAEIELPTVEEYLDAPGRQPLVLTDAGLAAPSRISGALDLTLWPGVVSGALPDAGARAANGAALQAALDWCAANERYAELPPGRYEYIAERVQDGVNVGLQLPVTARGLIGVFGHSGTRLIQYAVNHRGLTLGDVSADYNAATAKTEIGGFTVGYGVSQVGQTQAAAILFGRLYLSRFRDIGVDKWISGALHHPYIAAQFSPTPGKTFFFSNSFEGILDLNGGQKSIIEYQANGTGNNYTEIYAGGGSVGDRVVTTDPVVNIVGRYGLEFGPVLQLNIEWVAPAAGRLISNSADGLIIDDLHIEGAQMRDWGGSFIHNDAGYIHIRNLRILNPWIAAANASGDPAIVSTYGDARTVIEHLHMTCDGGSEYVQDMMMRIAKADGDPWKNPRIEVRGMALDGSGMTGTMRLDAGFPAIAPDGIGYIGGHRGYVHEPTRSRTEGAKIRMNNAPLTVYGQHRNSLVTLVPALTTNRDLVLSDKLTASGAGSTVPRVAGDIVRVHRAGAGAFNLVVKDHAAATLYTFVGAASAGTLKAFEWTGAAWVAL